jgi:hypothetical protein
LKKAKQLNVRSNYDQKSIRNTLLIKVSSYILYRNDSYVSNFMMPSQEETISNQITRFSCLFLWRHDKIRHIGIIFIIPYSLIMKNITCSDLSAHQDSKNNFFNEPFDEFMLCLVCIDVSDYLTVESVFLRFNNTSDNFEKNW